MNSPRPTEVAGRAAPTGKLRDVAGFLLFSHGWTWLFWGISGSWGTSVWELPATAFFVVGGAGVFLGGIVMSRVTYGAAGLRDLGRRIIDPRRIRAWWWTPVLLLYPVLTLVAAAISLTLGNASPPLDLPGAVERATDPFGLLAMMAFILVIGPLPEEIGWRGYLLDRLQLRWTALGTSLILGLIWWSWHLPLFLLPGYFDAFGRSTPSPLDFLAGIIPAAVVYTWLYNNTDRSVLAVTLLHFMQNFSGELLGMADATRPIRLGLEIVVAIAIVAWWGPATLRRSSAKPLALPGGIGGR